MKKLLCLMLTALLSLSAFGASALAEDSIKVGVIMDLTGANSEWGVAQAWGVQYAADQYNANGGINGYQLEVITLDCASDAQTAVMAYRQLVDEYEVNVIIAPAISNNVIPLTNLAEEDQICVVGHFQDDRCTENEETGETWKYMFLTQPSSSQQAKLLADYACEVLGFTTFGALYDEGNAFAMSLYTPFAEAIAANDNAEMIAAESFQSTDADYRAQATKITQLNPDAVFLPNYAASSALAYDQLREAGYAGTIIGPNTLQEPFNTLCTTKVENIYLLQNYDHYSENRNTTIVDAYMEESGMDYYVANAEFGYDDMVIVAEAMLKMEDPTDSVALAAALEQTNEVQLNSCTITLDPETHRPASMPMQIASYDDNNKLVIVDSYDLHG